MYSCFLWHNSLYVQTLPSLVQIISLFVTFLLQKLNGLSHFVAQIVFHPKKYSQTCNKSETFWQMFWKTV